MWIDRDKLIEPFAWLIIIPILVIVVGPLLLAEWCSRRFGPTREWTPWFAWRPVLTYDDKIVWLRTIERSRLAPYEDTDYRLKEGA